MKRNKRTLIGIALMIVMLLIVCGCSGKAEDSQTATEQKQDSMEKQNTMVSKIQIKVNGETLTAVMEDNSSAKALVELIGDDGLTLELEDYGDFEKVGPLPEELPTNDEQITTEAGDLILYQGNQFSLYYDRNSWNFTKLGHVEDITGEQLQKLLGDGNVTVNLTVEEKR